MTSDSINTMDYLWWHNDPKYRYKIGNHDDWYSKKYFSNWKAHIAPEELKIVDDIVEKLNPSSLIEVGCGGGWFTAEFCKRIPCVECIEFSQEGINKTLEVCKPKPRKIHKKDLCFPLCIPDRYEVAVCMEVAEHLEPPFAAMFAYNLTMLADAIYLTACEPKKYYYLSHPNEQYYEYWLNIFKFYGYEPFDRMQLKTVRGQGYFLRKINK